MRKFGIILFIFFSLNVSLFAQNHVSVPLGHRVYYILEQAEARGLCPPLPTVKPYSRAKVVEAITVILAAEPRRLGSLSDAERNILEDIRAEFLKGTPGLDPWKGMYRFSNEGKKGMVFSGDIGIAMESLNSVSFFSEEKESYFGTNTYGTLFFRGDVGERFSFDIDFSAGLMKAQRTQLGTYNTYASEVEESDKPEFENREIPIYSQPLAFFPYTYQKKWDGFLFGSEISASSMQPWPNGFSIAPSMLAEMSGSTLGDMLFLRAGRMQREWGGMMNGSSLALNAAARPFIGIEAIFNPISWFSFSSLSGVLEYYNMTSIYDDAATFQSAFSIQQMELNYGNYFHISFGSSAIWSKRFELGYMFPLLDNFFYQNFIGKFDNVAIHGSVHLRYPGLGGFWISGFIDEMEVSSVKQIFKLDRHMFAFQLGLHGVVPGVPFASIAVSYTKIEPYTYTHHRNIVPWYGDTPMEKAYVNNGVSLGYYTPPNSDEIKLRFDINPLLRTSGHWQYQLIRHGADYGPHQVDGSNLYSELDPHGRSSKESLKKKFLDDGAYQWMHIIKFGMQHTFGSLPLTIFGEAGLVYSYFTDISDEDYLSFHPDVSGDDLYQGSNSNTPRNYSANDYLASTAYILTIGIKIFK